MKKIKLLLGFAAIFVALIGNSQNIHNAKIIAIMELGQKDYAIVSDEQNQEIYKTAIYDRDMLIINESIDLEVLTDKKAKVIKPNINANIMAFKKHNGGNQLILNPSNKNNPYDFVGYYHNDLLDHLHKNIQEDDNFLTNNIKIYNLALEYIVLNQSIINDFDASANCTGSIDVKEGNNFKMAINSDAVVTNIEAVQALLFDNRGQNSNNKQSAIDNVISYENSVVVNTNLTRLEKQQILQQSAVLKYSTVYWDEFNGSSSNNIDKDTKVILMDAAGAIGGLIAGPIGSILMGAYYSAMANEYWD